MQLLIIFIEKNRFNSLKLGVNMLLVDYVADNAVKYKDKDAIVYIDSCDTRRVLSWHELVMVSNQISNMLLQKGIKKGDKVAIILPNCLEWLPIYFGVLKIGAIIVPINYNNSQEEICYCLEFVECVAAFSSSKITESLLMFNRLNEKICFYNVGTDTPDFWRMINEYSPIVSEIQIDELDDAAIYFSSGTTGKPKAVLLSHKALGFSAITELEHHHQKQDDHFLCLSPLYHTGSKIHWFGSMIVGGSIVIKNTFSPQNIVETIEKEQISIAWLVVPQMQDLLDAIEIKEFDLDRLKSLRLVHSGAQPIPKKLIKRWRTTFPNVLYDVSYGLTESTGPGCIDLGINTFGKDGSIGKASIGWEVRIVDDTGNEVGQREVGEITIKGPSLMTEYYKDYIATQKTLVGGWLYTGDMGYKDEDDFIYLVDRKKDIIISGGENIYPVQIEDFLRSFNYIKDVAVFGIPNPRLGECVAAVVELKPGMNIKRSDIYKACQGLPAYQRPLRIYLSHVIRNKTGKIDKKALKNKYLQGELGEQR